MDGSPSWKCRKNQQRRNQNAEELLTQNEFGMTQSELLSRYELVTVNAKRLAMCEPFICENQDLNDFFANDAVLYSKRLLGQTYMFCLKENPNVIVAAFTLSNDSIRMTNKLNEENKMMFLQSTELEEKHLRRFPAVLIGRLATHKTFAGLGIGTAVMDFIKSWFRTNNKTGCRFIIVDAYNNPATIHYYLKNQFKFLIRDEKLEAKYMGIGIGRLPLHTRLMYFDLLSLISDEDD